MTTVTAAPKLVEEAAELILSDECL